MTSASCGLEGADRAGGAPTLGPAFRGALTFGAGGAVGTVAPGTGTIPTTTWSCSSVVERDAGVAAAPLAMFDTAAGAGLKDVPIPADTDFAGAPVTLPAVLDEGATVGLDAGMAAGLLGGAGAADVLGEPGCAVGGVAAAVDGPVVGDGLATAPGPTDDGVVGSEVAGGVS